MWIINTKKIYKMKKLILSAGLFLTTLFYAQNTDIKTLIQKANQGNAEAQNNLGVAYYNGEGVEQSYSKAVYWYQKSAEQGNAVAQNNLGVSYYNGEGVEQSYSKAVYWCQKSAEQGNADAQYNLGVAYYNGEGVDKSYSKTVYWLRKACENFNDEACEFLNKIKK